MRAIELVPEEVILDCDTDDVKTVWTLKPLTNLENAYIRDRVTRIDAIQDAKTDSPTEVGFSSGTAQMLTVAFGVADVHNLLGKDGKEIRPQYADVKVGSTVFKRLSNAFIQLIPAPAFEELAVRIGKLSELTSEEVDALKSFREADKQPDVSGVSGE